jgi:hypothetical protein
MIEPMIFPRFRFAVGRHRCHNSGGSHVAMQGGPSSHAQFDTDTRKPKAKASAGDCTKTTHRYRHSAE